MSLTLVGKAGRVFASPACGGTNWVIHSRGVAVGDFCANGQGYIEEEL